MSTEGDVHLKERGVYWRREVSTDAYLKQEGGKVVLRGLIQSSDGSGRHH